MRLIAALALACGLVAAHESSKSGVSRRHHALANRSPVPEPEPVPEPGSHSVHFNATHLSNNVTHSHHLEKRAFSGRASWYDVGLGACGRHNVASDLIVALNSPQYGNGYPGPNCFKFIEITYGGKTVTAQIMDQCPGCPFGGLDMSKGLFQRFTGLGTGIFQMSWKFVGQNDDPPPKPTTTTHKPTPKPTTTTRRPTSTSRSTPRPTSTSTTRSRSSTTRTSTRSSTTRTSTTSTATTTSSAPTPTGPPPAPPGNLGDLEQAVFDLVALLDHAVPSSQDDN